MKLQKLVMFICFRSSFWHKTIILPSQKRAVAQWGLHFRFYYLFFPPSSSLAALCVSLATCNSFRFWKLATLLMRWCCDLYLHFSTCAIMTKCRKQLTFSMNFLFKATKLRQEILGIWQPKFCQNACEKFHYFHSFLHEYVPRMEESRAHLCCWKKNFLRVS